MPLQDITVTTNANSVSLSVFDPAQNAFMVTNLAGVTYLTNASIDGGVVMLHDSFEIRYFTYDPLRTNWVGGLQRPVGVLSTAEVSAGMVAWTVDTGVGMAIECRLYDQRRSQWAGTTLLASQIFTRTYVLLKAGSVLWWTDTSGIGYLVYDPAAGDWKSGRDPSFRVNAITTPFYHENGVIAWTTGSFPITSVVFDSLRSRWVTSVRAGLPVTRLESANGVVAWFSSPVLTFQVYDPVRGNWVATNLNTGGSSIFSISNATVYGRTTIGADFVYGYNPASGLWQANAITQPMAEFSASTTNGNPPLPVYFGDMSIAATRWSWDFDDGGASSMLQSPQHRFLGYRNSQVTLIVTSASGASSRTNVSIHCDNTPPIGSLTINNGSPWTANPEVELQTVASDNSGVVASNRFSNNNLTWSPWTLFRATNTWTLSSGFGPKTVFAQLSDALGNVASMGAPILYFTNPPPTLTFVSTNTSEALTRPVVQAVLNKTSLWSVSATFSLTDGTATFPADYSYPTNGLLTFSPGTTSQTFTVTISPDLITEQPETVQVGFINLTNAIAGPPGTLTIIDDDGPPILAAPRRNALGQFQMNVLADPGHQILVQGSETLSNWVSVTILTNTTGSVEFVDPTTSNGTSRLYRALLYR